jgi:hypothetical protein
MVQQGQVFKLKTKGVDGKPLWAYRYRLQGRNSGRRQVGGFATRTEAQRPLRKALDRLRPGGRAGDADACRVHRRVLAGASGAAGEAAVRNVAAGRSGRRATWAGVRADGRLRGGHRVAPSGAVRSGASRSRLQGGRGLRASGLRERTRMACQNAAEHARRAHATDGARGASAAAAKREPPRVPDLERRPHRPPQLPPARQRLHPLGSINAPSLRIGSLMANGIPEARPCARRALRPSL